MPEPPSRREFSLHPRLVADCALLGEFELCVLLHMNDANYPWCILVPRRAGIREVYQLAADEQALLWRESALLGQAMMDAFGGDKLNLAALGNEVPQLHIHHVVRRRGDTAWPRPVWGAAPPSRYTAQTAQWFRASLVPRLGAGFRAATV